MLLFIYLCIAILNTVAIYLSYKFLGSQMEKKEKWIFIIVGIAVMYIIVTSVYWLSTHSIDIGMAKSTAQNLITFAFVPVNSMLILPFMASSYRYFKEGKLKATTFKNRLILLAVILVIILIIEFFYFKNIQNGILSIIQTKK